MAERYRNRNTAVKSLESGVAKKMSKFGSVFTTGWPHSTSASFQIQAHPAFWLTHTLLGVKVGRREVSQEEEWREVS